MTPGLLLLQSAAVLSSLAHIVLDARIGIYGSGAPVSVGQLATLFAITVLYGWWLSPVAAATSGIRGAMLALVIVAGFWTGIANGAVGLAACPITCPGAEPLHDVTHVASLVFGAWAAGVAWRAYRAMSGDTQLAPSVTAVVLIVATLALQAVNATVP